MSLFFQNSEKTHQLNLDVSAMKFIAAVPIPWHHMIEIWELQISFEGHLDVVMTNKYVEQTLALAAVPLESIQLTENLTS